MNSTSSRRRPTVGAIAAIVIATGSVTGGQSVSADARAGDELDGQFTRPEPLTTEVADLIVRVAGGATCTGTPISGGTLVVTAAHCVLETDGDVAQSRTVTRNGDTYDAEHVLVNPRYHQAPSARLDVAVLVMAEPIPGPSATPGDSLPEDGRVTLAGFQPLDSDGSLLRGTRYDNRPRPTVTSGNIVEIESAAAGCIGQVSDVQILDDQMKVPCGLIPGASGGGLFVERDGDLILIGVISTVAYDLSFNGVAPFAAVRELLNNASAYSHEMGEGSSTYSRPYVTRW
jgi:hypothetical protein